MPFGGPFGALSFSVSIADTSVGEGLPANYDNGSYDGDDQSSGDDASDDALCPGTFYNGAGAGFWLKLDDVRPGMRLELTSCGLDTDLFVFSGPSCSELGMVACNGDGDVEGCDTDYPSRISGLEVVAGAGYYVVVTGYEGATGAATVTASYTFAPPPTPPPPPSPPITCECETIIVAGAEAVQSTRMGTFTRMAIMTPDGRSVYQNHNSQYLYFWLEYSNWRISPDYTSNLAVVASFSADSAICPMDASGWHAYNGSMWITPSGGINVSCAPPPPPPPPPQPPRLPAPPSPPITCACETIIVAGAEAVQWTRMGTFTRTSLTTPDGRSVYQSSNSEYLYFWAEFSEWRISNDYTSAAAGGASSSGDSAICPMDATGSQAWDWSTWITPSGGITVSCAPSPPPQPPAQPPSPPQPPSRPSVPGRSCESAMPFGGPPGALDFSVSIDDTSVGEGLYGSSDGSDYDSYQSYETYDNNPSDHELCPGTAFTGTGLGIWLKLDDVRPGMLLELTSCGFFY
jgi:hypothetical protein